MRARSPRGHGGEAPRIRDTLYRNPRVSRQQLAFRKIPRRAALECLVCTCYRLRRESVPPQAACPATRSSMRGTGRLASALRAPA